MEQVFDPHSYTLNPYAIPMLVTAAVMFLLGIVVFSRERGSLESRLFLLVALTVTIWLFSFSGMYAAVAKSVAMWWAKAAYLGIPFIPAAIYHFAVVILRIYEERKSVVWSSWLLSATFSFLFVFTDLLFGDLYRYAWGYYPQYRWLSVPYLFFFVGLLIGSLWEFWFAYRRSTLENRRRRIRSFMFAFGLGYLASLDYVAVFGVPLYPFGYLPVLIFLGLIAQTIRRYQLVDITPSFAANEIIAIMADPLIVCDEERRICVVNQAACTTFGYTRQELLGRQIDCLVYPQGDDVVRLREILQLSILRDEQMVFRNKQGQPIDVSISSSRLQEQATTGVVVIARDVRKQKREQALAAGQKKVLEMATTGAPLDEVLAALIQNIEGQFEEVIGSILLLDEDQKHLRRGAALNLPEAYNRAIDGLPIGPRAGSCGTAAYRREAVIVADIDTDPLWADYREIAAEHGLRACWSVPILSSREQVLGTFAIYYRSPRRPNKREWKIIEDTLHIAKIVIEHKQTAEAQRKNEERVKVHERLAAVGQLAAGIAHDFNNALGPIVLYSKMLQQTLDLTAKDEQRLSVIYDQAQHASHLTRQILDFSRRSIMARQPTDLLDILKKAVHLLESTLPENIALDLVCDGGDYVVEADPTRLQQVIMNLALNARDAMPDGGYLRFKISQLAPDQPPPLPEMPPALWIRLSVADTGCGIEPEALPHIFEPFFTTKGPDRGTGLGLAQIYGIIQQHGGFITVDSQPGAGATFTFYLPAMHDPRAASPAAVEDAVFCTGEGTILLVEDHAPTCQAVQETLEAAGYSVFVAGDGESALVRFCEHQEEIDLVVSDMLLPGISGIELYQKLQRHSPTIRMLLMTGYPLDAQGKDLLEQGVVDWIQKPFDAEGIARKVQKALSAESGRS